VCITLGKRGSQFKLPHRLELNRIRIRMNPERTGRRVKNRIKNQVILEMLVDRIAIGVRKDRDMDEYIEFAGNNVQDRWEKIFIKIY